MRVENLVAGHLSILVETKDDGKIIGEAFPDEQLHNIEGKFNFEPWYANIVNYLIINELPYDINPHYKNKLKSESRLYI